MSRSTVMITLWNSDFRSTQHWSCPETPNWGDPHSEQDSEQHISTPEQLENLQWSTWHEFMDNPRSLRVPGCPTQPCSLSKTEQVCPGTKDPHGHLVKSAIPSLAQLWLSQPAEQLPWFNFRSFEERTAQISTYRIDISQASVAKTILNVQEERPCPSKQIKRHSMAGTQWSLRIFPTQTLLWFSDP